MPTIKCLQKRMVNFLNTRLESDDKNSAIIFSKPYEDIFKYLWQLELPENIKIPEGNNCINRKGASESEAFRNEGNRLYKGHKFEKALLAYNYAILAAPHPTVTFQDDGREASDQQFQPPYRSQHSEGQHSELALAFANRSALLLEMEQNQAAMSDIHYALLYGYPYSKQYKMFERKVKCLINLDRLSEAESLSTSILANVSTFELSQSELSQLQSNLSKQISKCSSSVPPPDAGNTSSKQDIPSNKNKGKSQKPQSKMSSGKEGKFWRLFYRGGDDVTLSGLRATKGDDRQTNSSLAVSRSANRGCHLLATRDIRPGELLLVESSAVSFLAPGPLLRTHCSHCLRRAPAPLPCPSCSLAIFCDADCRHASLSSAGGHSVECSLLPALVALQPEVDAGLALRAATALGWQGLLAAAEGSHADGLQEKNGKGLDKDSKTNTVNSKAMGGEETNLVDLQKIIEDRGMDNKFLYSLEGNHSSRTKEDKREAGITALLLVKLLLKCPTFWRSSEDAFDSSKLNQEDIMKVGGQLIHLLLNIQCNAHCVKEFQVKSGQPLTQSTFLDLGYALHRQLSLLNHSCAANCHVSSCGNRKLLYAVTSISKGDEVTLSYGERFVSHDKQTRQNNLKQTYYFECDCIACTLNWHLFAELPMKFSLRCCKCSGSLDAASAQCTKCQLVHKIHPQKKSNKKGKKSNQQETPKDVYDATAVQSLISKAWQEYNQGYANMEKIQTDQKDINKVTNLLSLMDKYAHLPNKPYIEAQETCMRWYDLKASATFCVE